MQVAFYKAPGTLVDKAIREFTHGSYSHCEIVIDGIGYTSTARDGGVRSKAIDFTDTNTWDLVDVSWAFISDALSHFEQTKGTPYSYTMLILDQVFNLNFNADGASFCSEWCAEALHIPSAAVYNPNTLYDLLVFMRKVMPPAPISPALAKRFIAKKLESFAAKKEAEKVAAAPVVVAEPPRAKYLLKPSTKAHRAKHPMVHLHPGFTLMSPIGVPSSADLSVACSPVENQGTLGSCSGHAFSGAIEYLENSKHFFAPDKDSLFRVSRLFTYYNERILERDTDQDAGAFIHDGITALSTYGICRETVWPYDISKFAVKPHDNAYADAATRKITKFAQVINTDTNCVKQVLASGYPIIFGIQIYQSFESDEVAKTGIVQMPQPGEKCLGGHAVLMVGYNDETQRVLVRNSWGPDWGIGGYFTLPYAYITNMRLTSDAWVINN